MLPQEWNAVLAPDELWQLCYPIVEREARAVLSTHKGPPIKTMELMERLYPSVAMRGETGMAARRRLIRALLTLAKYQLGDCAERGPQREVMGKVSFPWVWSASDPKRVAPEFPGKKTFVKLTDMREAITKAVEQIDAGDVLAGVELLRPHCYKV